MSNFIANKEDKNSEKIQILLNGSRKKSLSIIDKTLHKIGHFGNEIIVESLQLDEESPFSESFYVTDTNCDKFYFSAHNLYKNSKMITEFLNDKYNYVIAKKNSDNKYTLYNGIFNYDEIGNVYINEYGILCAFTDELRYNLIYKSKIKPNIEYGITISIDEKLSEDEVNFILNRMGEKQPKTLLEYLENFRLTNNLSNYSTISIFSNNSEKTVGEIQIKYGNLYKFDINESKGLFSLNMKSNAIIQEIETTKLQKIAIAELPEDLKITYEKGKQFLKEFEKKGINN